MSVDRRHLIRLLTTAGPFLGLIVVYAIFLIAAPAEDVGAIKSLYGIKTMLQQTVIIGIAALGMTVIIVSAGIDLSVGSLLALGTVVTARALQWLGPEVVWWMPLVAALACMAACALAGAVNGFCESRRIPAQLKNVGSMFHVFLQRDPINSMRDVRPGKGGAEKAFYLHALNRGVLVPGTQRAFLSAAHHDAEIDLLIDVFQASLDDVQREGFFES